MDVHVTTKDGERSGSSIRRIRYIQSNMPRWSFLGESRPQVDLKGEAVIVHLPMGKILFALLTGNDNYVDYAARIPDLAIPDLWSRARSGKKTSRVIELYPRSPPEQRVRISDLPKLVTFRDPRDPKTIEVADPMALERTLGNGTKLKRITIQITNGPASSGIDAVIPSYGPETGFDEWYKSLRYDDRRRVAHDSFKQG